MKRLIVASLMALAASVLVSDTASAQQGFGYMSGYGFGVPFARFTGAVQTAPYFATNPPVYYGSRYARPYGMSPYAALPMVNAPAGYMGQPAAQFYRPPAQTAAPVCNPCVSGHQSQTPKAYSIGKVQSNPFVEPAEKLAKN